MDIDIITSEGASLGRRKIPLPPRQGEILLLPRPYPEAEHTMSELDRASWSELLAYRVVDVVWDMVATAITVVVEPIERPEALR